MANLLEQGFYLGLGTLSMTANKVEETISSLIEKAHLKPEDGKELKDKLISEGEKAREQVQTQFLNIIAKSQELLPCNKRFIALENRIKALEEKLAPPKAEK